MRHDQLILLEKFVGYPYTFTQQTARILAKIEHQTFEVAHLIERFRYLMLGRLLESGDVYVADAGLDNEVQVNAVARNLVADDSEFQRMIGAFAQHRDADSGAFRPLEQIGHVGGAHVVGGLAVDGGDDVAGTNAGTIGWSSDKGRDDNNLIVARPDGHAYAVIFAALLFS